jgi:DNA-binding FadR family transcriptional regulator
MIDQAVASATEEQVQQLYAILERMRTPISRGEDYTEEDRLFHRTLWANVKNRSVGKLVDVFWMVFSQARRHAAVPSNPNLLEIYQWHVNIVDALAKRDVAAARVAMVQHYGNIQKLLEEMRIHRNGHSPVLTN